RRRGARVLAKERSRMNDKSKFLLIVDDDTVYRQRLALAMEKRGFIVRQAESVASRNAAAQAEGPGYAVCELRRKDGTGRHSVTKYRKSNPQCRVVMLTGYGNIATAVAAIKHGAADYLPKPADADDVARALLAARDGAAPAP